MWLLILYFALPSLIVAVEFFVNTTVSAADQEGVAVNLDSTVSHIVEVIEANKERLSSVLSVRRSEYIAAWGKFGHDDCIT